MPIKVEVIGGEKLDALGEFYRRTTNTIPGRLAQATLAFLIKAEGTAKKNYLTGPRPQKLAVGKGRLRASITERVRLSGNNIEGVLGTNVKYARIHELGGQIQKTPRMRAFFWAKFRDTGEDFWKGMALSKKTVINIPARPFLAPSVQDELPAFERSIAATLQQGLSHGDQNVQ